MSETVLVTGGTGYVAGWCILRLLEAGYTVRTTVRSISKADQLRRALPDKLATSHQLSFRVADLTADAGWIETMQGCDYVLHVASPLGITHSNKPEELITTAVDGTLRVIKAAADTHVKRVVMTSAANTASPTSYKQEGVTDETLWTDPDAAGIIPYRRSKTLAERAAWDYIEQAKTNMTLTTILPGAVFGPALSPDNLNSVQVIGRLMRGEMPGVPNIGLEVVDVRDIADIHIRAMRSEAAANQRFLATGEFLWMADIAQILHQKLGPAAHKVPTRRVPDIVMRGLALFRPELRDITVSLGRKNRHTTDKARQLLGWQARPAADTVVDCANSLLRWGLA